MKKMRMFLVASVLGSMFVVGSAAPASANCEGEPNVCVLICSIKPVEKALARACHTW